VRNGLYALTSCARVARHRCRCRGRVKVGHLVAVSEESRHHRGRDLANEVADRSVACTEEVDPEIAQSVHDGVRVEVCDSEAVDP
jgi:ferredoxin-fold anticodon binding domain-containing protein